MKIIGFGKTCSAVSKELAKASGFEYRNITKDDYPPLRTIEEAEKIKTDFSFDVQENEEIIFICSGDEKISGGIIRTLEQIKHCKINLLYLLKDKDLLSEAIIEQQRTIFKILQNYARSGLFENILCIDEAAIKKQFIADVSMLEYEKKLSEMLAKMINMVNWLHHADPFYSEINPPNDACRIKTLGVFADSEEKLIFSLDNVRQKDVYFACTEKTLAEDINFMEKVKETLKFLKSESENLEYKIVKTDYEQDFIYLSYHTNFIQ